jgi:signal transduction histidine kinase/CheY-like chemotaxis protein
MLPIRRLLLRDLLTLVGATVGVLCLGFTLGTFQLLERQGDQRARELVASLGEDLHRGFRHSQVLGLAAREWWSAGLIDLDRPEQVEALLLPMVETNGLVAGVFLHTPEGKGLLLTRPQAGEPGQRGPWATFIFERREGRLLQRRYREAGVTIQDSRWEPAFLDPATRPWYLQGLKAYRPNWVEPYHFFGGDTQGLTFVVPLRLGDGSLKGILSVDANLEDLTGRMWESRLGPGKLLLTDGDGRALVLPRYPELSTISARSQAFLRKIDPSFLAAFHALGEAWTSRSPSDTTVTFRQGGTYYLGFVDKAGFLEGTTWTLQYIIPVAELLAPARTSLLLMTILGLACFGFATYRVLRLSKKVGIPLQALSEAAGVLRSGGVPEPLPSGIHEFKALGDALHEAGKERTVAEEQQRQSEHRQRLETVGTLAGGIAHDVNNQLMTILGQLDLIRGQFPSNHSIARRLDRSEQAARRCSQMIRSLLAFTHNAKPEVRPVDLNQLVEDASSLIGRVLGGLIDLRLDLEPNLPLVVAEPIELEQVLMNLAVNARDAMVGGGTLRISTRRGPGDQLIVTVEDTGPGIAPDILPHIFEPFFTTKEIGKGTGLGLSMVHGIIKAHQGTITVSSQQGTGTQFRILLPGRPDLTTSERMQALEPRKEVDLAGLRILLVDDEPLVRETMSELLTLHGAEVRTAVDGDEGFDLWRQHRFDLLVTDQRMPRCTGLELIARIRAGGGTLPALIVSGYGMEGMREIQEQDPRLRVLGKPFETSRLLGLLGELARLA